MWLDDSVINAYGHLVQQDNPDVMFLSTFVHVRLSTILPNQTDNQRLEAAFRDCQSRDILEPRVVFVPINVNNNHGILSVIDNKAATIAVYDSAGGSHRDVAFRIRDLAVFVSGKFSRQQVVDVNRYKILSKVPSIPRQTNGHDCGMFCLIYADCLARGVRLTFSQADMPAYRRRVLMELLTGVLVPRQ
jgi:sentrin-specific protease 1